MAYHRDLIVGGVGALLAGQTSDPRGAARINPNAEH
jgi:hypothetical protein